MPSTTIVDLLGRAITLHQSAWSVHIASRHPEVAPHRRLVESAIANPLVITHSRADPDCRLYHGPGPRPGVMIKVVADILRGVVKTAHLVRKVSPAESVEWSSQSS